MLALLALPALLEPVRLAVLPILVAPGPDATASKVFAAVDEAAALRRSLDVMSIDDYFFREGGELANRALACGQDTACIAEQLAPFEAELGLVVVINLDVSPPLLSLILLDTAKGTVEAELYTQVEGGTTALFDRLRAEAAKMLDARGFARSGRLLVTVTPRHAALAVAGHAPDLGAPNQFTLDAGTYEITAVAEGYAPANTQATVIGGGTTQVALALEEEVPLHESPWLWIAGAVVVVGAAVGVGLAASASRTDCLCVLTAGERSCDVCR